MLLTAKEHIQRKFKKFSGFTGYDEKLDYNYDWNKMWWDGSNMYFEDHTFVKTDRRIDYKLLIFVRTSIWRFEISLCKADVTELSDDDYEELGRFEGIGYYNLVKDLTVIHEDSSGTDWDICNKMIGFQKVRNIFRNLPNSVR